MVSLEKRQNVSEAINADADLRRIQRLLDGETISESETPRDGIREQLLQAISAKDGLKFNEIADDLGKRKIGPDCDWCQDDFLVFLLLLGNELFGHSVSCIQRVIEARRNTPNSLPQKINEVFAALYRQEFGIDGELAFLKVPFLHVTGHLKIGARDAGKVLTEVSDSELWNQFSPFLRLLTQKAHDLVLISRTPQVAETSDELIEGFKKHAKNLTLRQWWNVLCGLPGKLVLSVIGTIFGLGLIVILFGFGVGLVEKKFNVWRERPDRVYIEKVSTTQSNLPVEVSILGSDMQNMPTTLGNSSLNVCLTCEHFSTPTPSFVIEVSHPEKAIRKAVVFIQNTETGERPFTVIPVLKEHGRYRIVLPELETSVQLVILLNIEVGPKEVVSSVINRFVLRSLQ